MPSAQFAHGLVQNSPFLGRVQACADTVSMLAHSLYTRMNKACSSLRTAQQNAVTVKRETSEASKHVVPVVHAMLLRAAQQQQSNSFNNKSFLTKAFAFKWNFKAYAFCRP